MSLNRHHGLIPGFEDFVKCLASLECLQEWYHACLLAIQAMSLLDKHFLYPLANLMRQIDHYGCGNINITYIFTWTGELINLNNEGQSLGRLTDVQQSKTYSVPIEVCNNVISMVDYERELFTLEAMKQANISAWVKLGNTSRSRMREHASRLMYIILH